MRDAVLPFFYVDFLINIITIRFIYIHYINIMERKEHFGSKSIR